MKKIYLILTFLLCVYIQTANAQMGVNSTGQVPDASAMLDIRSTNKGFLLPRLSTFQRNTMPAISNGLMIYNTNTNEIEVYRGFAGWVAASRMAVPFVVSGSDVGGIIQSTNSGSGSGMQGFSSSGPAVIGTSSSGIGVHGSGDQGLYGVGTSTGVYGTSTTGAGTFGKSDSFRGVWGRGLTTGDGVYGDATSGKGVYGQSSAGGTGVYGESVSGNGGFFTSTSGTAVGITSTSGTAINGTTTSTSFAASFANFGAGPVLSLTSFGGGPALTMLGALRVTGTASTKTAFKVVSAAPDIFINQLIIPNTTLANNPNDILIVTHNYGTGAVGSFNKAIGVIWDLGLLNWRIYVEDGTAMPVGVTFNVLVIKQ